MSHERRDRTGGTGEPGETPPTVVAAIAAGVAPAPFLVTYAVLFILHGTVFPVDPPDITGSKGGEAFAGLVVLAFLGLLVVGIGWFLSQRTRWLFLIGQAATLGVSIDFLLDSSSGRPTVPLVLAVTSSTAIVLGCVPASWTWASNWSSPLDASNTPAAEDAVLPPGRARYARRPRPAFGDAGGAAGWSPGRPDAGHGYSAPTLWAPGEPDAGPIDPNPGGGQGAGAPGSA